MKKKYKMKTFKKVAGGKVKGNRLSPPLRWYPHSIPSCYLKLKKNIIKSRTIIEKSESALKLLILITYNRRL